METIAGAISLALVGGLPIAWLTSEVCNASKFLRLALGVACIVVGLNCFLVGNKMFTLQKRHHAQCFRQIAVLLDKGDVATVKRAAAAYNEAGESPALQAEEILSGRDRKN
jgi:hypothetical protein